MNKIHTHLSRRHLISTIATGSGLGFCHSFLPGSVFASPSRVWKGEIFGTPLHIRFHDSQKPDHPLDTIFPQFLEQIENLDPTSDQSQFFYLNTYGKLDNPSDILVRFMHKILYYHKTTDGVFDPALSSARYAQNSVSDFRSLSVQPHKIALANMIGQLDTGGIMHGFILDQFAIFLEKNNYHSFELSLGNIHLTSSKINQNIDRQHQATAHLDLTRETIFHPRNQSQTSAYKTIEVIMENASDADVFSTVFAMMDCGQISRILARSGGGTAILTHADSSCSRQVIRIL